MRVHAHALAALAAAVLIAADEPAKTPKDPQSTFEPRSSPGAGQAFLKRFEGDWSVVKTFHPRNGAPVRTEGTCRQALVHGGRFLQSDFVFKSSATTSTGTGLIGFEPEAGRFTSTWIDSRQTRMSFRQSAAAFDGARIVLESRSLEPDATATVTTKANGKGRESRRSKTVTTLENDDRRIVHRQYAVGPDAAERLMMELVLTRKGQ